MCPPNTTTLKLNMHKLGPNNSEARAMKLWCQLTCDPGQAMEIKKLEIEISPAEIHFFVESHQVSNLGVTEFSC